ncbi:pyridoxal phosphate-dependent aminotransferase [Flavisphingomonas formosensis]|uniref:pyridoxal phosphate-dependent aminotransferase n=1 Tax=Flavisphingomonas formosensis TaxID=861534 RepID=UPI0012FA66EE|nr:pyridoxal phosphate-dependent aminotransferase [Sphingomonas formosensis]
MRDVARNLPASLIREVANQAMGQPGLTALWFGETDQPTDPIIRQAAIDSLAAGETFYSANLGLPELRDAIAAYQDDRFGGASSRDNVVVTVSGLNAILLALSAIVDPGDEVVVITPTWPNLAAIPTLLGASVRLAELTLTEAGYRLDADRLAQTLGPRTRAVIVNSPHNPSGWMISREELKELVDLLDHRGIWLLMDEVYTRLVHSGSPVSVLPLRDDGRRIITVNSFSKTWAMTGWRLGWLTVPANAIGTFEKLMEFNTSCAPVFAQRAGIAAIEHGEAFVAAQQRRLMEARAAVIDVLGAHPRIQLPPLDATFYAFPRIDGLVDGKSFALRAIAEEKIGLAPGEAFGEAGRGHVRLCYARDPATVRGACERMAALIDRLPD